LYPLLLFPHFNISLITERANRARPKRPRRASMRLRGVHLSRLIPRRISFPSGFPLAKASSVAGTKPSEIQA
jgi:hypothetical protein